MAHFPLESVFWLFLLLSISSLVSFAQAMQFDLDSATPFPEIDSFASASVCSGYVFVSCFYRKRSKHSVDNYKVWVSDFLNIFEGCLFFYTNSAELQEFPALTSKPNIYPRVGYPDPFDIPCVRNLSSKYQEQSQLDPDGGAHHPDLFAIWNSKNCLLKEVSDEFPTAVAFWIDSGSMREKIYHGLHFPNRERLNQLFARSTGGRMIYAFWRPGMLERRYPVRMYRNVHAIGGFFGGDHRAIQTFYRRFWRVHNYFMERGDYIGDDQHIINTILVYSEPSWIQPNYLAWKCDTWFASFSFYSNTKLCFRQPAVFSDSATYVTGEPLQWDPLFFE
jgi:hypothetical protein